MILDKSDIQKFIDYKIEKKKKLELEEYRLKYNFNKFLLDNEDVIKTTIRECIPSSEVAWISDECFKGSLIHWLNGYLSYGLPSDTYETIITEILGYNGIIIDTQMRAGFGNWIVDISAYIDIEYLIGKLNN